MQSRTERPKRSAVRIRIGREEVELVEGVTLIGRDPSCEISIPDPQISRRHARVQFDGASATIEDLGSSNGTRVNGVLISGPHALCHGDRVTWGLPTRTLGSEAGAFEDEDVPTRQVRLCAQCSEPIATAHSRCPRCGAPVQSGAEARPDEATRRGGRWSLGLVVEMLGKAILGGSATDADRLMREAAMILSDHLRESTPIDPEELKALDAAAEWLAKKQQKGAWSDWSAQIRQQVRGRSIKPPT